SAARGRPIGPAPAGPALRAERPSERFNTEPPRSGLTPHVEIALDGCHPPGVNPPCDLLVGRPGSRRSGLATGSTISCDPDAGPGPTHPEVSGYWCCSSRTTRTPHCRGLTLRLAPSCPSRLRLVRAFRIGAILPSAYGQVKGLFHRQQGY